MANLTTARTSFFEIAGKGQALFDVNEGLPIADALESASMLLSLAVGLVGKSAHEADSELALSAAHLVEMAKSVVDAASLGLRNGGVCHE